MTHVRSRECWFCLSSPSVESHLIISVTEHLYCALAKGPLVDDHVLLIPVEHSPNTLSLPSDCQKELHKYQSCLRMFGKTQRKEFIFFELISKRSTHANLQVRAYSVFLPGVVSTWIKESCLLVSFTFHNCNKLFFKWILPCCSWNYLYNVIFIELCITTIVPYFWSILCS